jgi:peroxiredoxin
VKLAGVAAAAASLLLAAGCGGHSNSVDRGGFTSAERSAAQTGLDTLLRTSISSIVVANTTSKGIPVCRLHLEQKTPATFRLFIVWNPRGQFARAATGNIYSWLSVLLRQEGPNLQTWHLANVASPQAVTKEFKRAASAPAEPCQILNSGRIQLIAASDATDAQTQTLLHLAHPPVVYRPAPGFVLPRIDAPGTVSLDSLRGHVAVLNFWSTSCAACASAATRLQAAAPRLKAQHVAVIGVDEFDFLADARRFLKENRITYPTLRDSGRTGKRFGVNELPQTFVLDAQGLIVAKLAGAPTQAGLRAAVARALAR